MIQHVTHTIAPSQLEECVAFYGLLGFRQVPVPEGIEGRAIWLEHERDGSAAQIHLMPRADASPGQGHHALVLPDYEAAVEALRDAGHEVEDRRRHWGSPRSYVRDPAGHLIELIQWRPGGERA